VTHHRLLAAEAGFAAARDSFEDDPKISTIAAR
jgi:hypothetical protein